jgi:predicted RNase H-like HicB family nuclease
MIVMQYKVTVLIEKDEHGYYACSPELKGCQTQAIASGRYWPA